MFCSRDLVFSGNHMQALRWATSWKKTNWYRRRIKGHHDSYNIYNMIYSHWDILRMYARLVYNYGTLYTFLNASFDTRASFLLPGLPPKKSPPGRQKGCGAGEVPGSGDVEPLGQSSSFQKRWVRLVTIQQSNMVGWKIPWKRRFTAGKLIICLVYFPAMFEYWKVLDEDEGLGDTGYLWSILD